MRLATGALVRADVPNDGEAPEYSQGDAVAVHLRAGNVQVLAADDEGLIAGTAAAEEAAVAAAPVRRTARREPVSPRRPPADARAGRAHPRAPPRSPGARARAASADRPLRRARRSRRRARAARSARRPESQSCSSPLAMPSSITSREPLAHALVEPRAGRPQRLVTRGPQPQLDPQHEVVAHRPGLRQALLDHRREPLGGARLVRSGHLDARVPRALVGVLERLRAGALPGRRSGSGPSPTRRPHPSRSARSARRRSPRGLSGGPPRPGSARVHSSPPAHPTSKHEMRFR